jgi:hypothetical protein
VEKHYALTVSRKILSIFHLDDFVPFSSILQFHFKDVFIEAFGHLASSRFRLAMEIEFSGWMRIDKEKFVDFPVCFSTSASNAIKTQIEMK